MALITQLKVWTARGSPHDQGLYNTMIGGITVPEMFTPNISTTDICTTDQYDPS